MSEISGHDPDFKYIIALNRLMTCLFPLNSGNLSFRDSLGRAKPNGMREGANEKRGAGVDENTNSYAERHRLRSGLFLFWGRNIFSALSRAPFVHI